jgi:hypothetical protein
MNVVDKWLSVDDKKWGGTFIQAILIIHYIVSIGFTYKVVNHYSNIYIWKISKETNFLFFAYYGSFHLWHHIIWNPRSLPNPWPFPGCTLQRIPRPSRIVALKNSVNMAGWWFGTWILLSIMYHNIIYGMSSFPTDEVHHFSRWVIAPPTSYPGTCWNHSWKPIHLNTWSFLTCLAILATYLSMLQMVSWPPNKVLVRLRDDPVGIAFPIANWPLGILAEPTRLLFNYGFFCGLIWITLW